MIHKGNQTLIDTITVKELGEDDMILTGGIVQNNIPVLEENFIEKMNANNGFSKERLFRKIASIPIAAVFKARQDGYNLDDRKDLERFLSDNPDYMTVERINSNRTPNIIVK